MVKGWIYAYEISTLLGLNLVVSSKKLFMCDNFLKTKYVNNKLYFVINKIKLIYENIKSK